MAYIRNGGTLTRCPVNLAQPGICNFIDGPAADDDQRPAVAIRSDGYPAYAYYRPGVGALVSFWTGAAFQRDDPVPGCAGGFPSVALGADDVFLVSCLDAGGVDVNFSYEIKAANWQTETALGNGVDVWSTPEMVVHNGVPHIAAYNVTKQEVWYARRLGPNNWEKVLVEAVIAVGSVSISVSPAGRVAVVYMGDVMSAIRYAERAPAGGAFTAHSRVDGGEGGGLPNCFNHATPVRVRFAGDGALHASWATQAVSPLMDRQGLHIARFAQWERPWTLSSESGELATHLLTSLALDGEDTPWTCFYAESPVNPPAIALFARHAGQAPIYLAEDVGLPTSYARGCDIAVAPNGTVGLAFADTVRSKLKYYYLPPGQALFWVGPELRMPGDAADPGEHLALRFDDLGRPAVAYRHGGLGALRYALLDGGQWAYSVPNGGPGAGSYLDLAFDAADGVTPLISYFRTAGGVNAAWVAAWHNGAWQNVQVSGNGAGWDTSIATRVVGGDALVAVSYHNFGNGTAEVVVRDGAGLWQLPREIDPPRVLNPLPRSYGEFTRVAIDAMGKPMVTYRDYVHGQGFVLQTARWSPFAGGRVLPDPPEPRYVACSMEKGGLGTSQAPDAFDNWRVTHKLASSTTLDRFFLNYLSRP